MEKRTRGIYAEDYTAGGHVVIVAIDARGDSRIRVTVSVAVDQAELVCLLTAVLDLLDPPSGTLLPRRGDVDARAALALLDVGVLRLLK